MDYKGSTPLHWASYLGCENAVYYLSSWKTEINLPDNDGKYTPLHLGVISGNAKVVRRLLIKGADVNIVDKTGKTPSDLAKANEFGNIYEMIEQPKGFMDTYKVKPPLKPVQRSRKSLFLFFILYFGSNLCVYLMVFPCKIDYFI